MKALRELVARELVGRWVLAAARKRHRWPLGTEEEESRQEHGVSKVENAGIVDVDALGTTWRVNLSKELTENGECTPHR